jgi:hypothetical protein
MKKLLFLLFITISGYSQTLPNPIYGTVTIKNSATVTTTPALTTTEATGLQKKIDPANLPISAATSTALNLKANTSGTTFTGNIGMSGTPTTIVDSYTKVVRDEITGDYKYLNLQASQTLADKIRLGSAFTIACEGTSLTYGQNTTTGTIPGINGSSIIRNANPYPETLQSVLTLAGYSATVTNRGYPGDRTSEGLTRWASAPATDVTVLEYATNDANNYAGFNGGGSAGYLSVAVFKKNYRQLIQRRLNQGSFVILTIPTSIPTDAENNRLNAYFNAIYDLANEYACPVIDSQKQVSWVNNGGIWSDVVHHTNIAANEWGAHIAYFFINKGINNISVGSGKKYSPNSMILTSSSAKTTEANATYGNLITLPVGYKRMITVYVKDRVQMYVKTFSSSGTRSIDFYYGDGVSKSMITVTNTSSTPTASVRADLFVLEPGFRTITVINSQPSTVSYIDMIGFDNVDSSVLHTSGNEVFTGVKTAINETTSPSQSTGLDLINNGGFNSRVLKVTNNGAGLGAIFTSNSTGFGTYHSVNGSGAGSYIFVGASGTGQIIDNNSTGVGAVYGSALASTSNLIEFKKNAVLKGKIDSDIKLTIPALNISDQTASTVAIFDTSKNIFSASTAIYPNLTEFSYGKGVTSPIQAQINSKVNIASPAFTGIPTAPTATAGTNTTQIANTAYVKDNFIEIANSYQRKLGGLTIANTNIANDRLDMDYSGIKNYTSTGFLNFQLVASGVSDGGFKMGTASYYLEAREGFFLKTSTPIESPSPTISAHLANKAYTDTKAPIESPTFTGVVTLPKINLTTGLNSAVGNATMVAGTVTINTTAATTNSIVMLTRNSAGITGFLSYSTTNGTLTINSTIGVDAGTISYLIIN